MKKLITSLLVIIFSLGTTGCFGDATPTDDAENPLYYKYSSTTFAVEVPNDWEVISQFTSDYPDNTLVVFRNNLKDMDFIANVNIVAESVDKDLGNGDYALETLQFHSESLIDYKLIEQQEVEIKINSQMTPTYLNYFEGRNSISSDLLKFVQVYGTNNGLGYIITGTFLPDEDEFIRENCVHVVKSLEIK